MFCKDAIIESFTFPDGQPHIKVGFPDVSGKVRITNPDDLFRVCLLAKTTRIPTLQIFYLMGGRMDRELSLKEPRTLKVVCDILNELPVDRFYVFGPHSRATLDLLRDSRAMRDEERNVHAKAIYRTILDRSEPFSIVIPDMGAARSFEEHYADVLLKAFPAAEVVLLHKHRDLRTGAIHGHKLVDGAVHSQCIILDDLCDGGATFRSAASILRANGAKAVFLSVLHGVLSKGESIEGIDHIVTTNSYCDRPDSDGLSIFNVMG